MSLLSEEQRAKVRAAVAANPTAMTLQLARDLGVPECEVIRAMPDGRSIELDVITCEVNGEFGGFSTWGEFFNVQTPTLDLHVRFERLGAAFAVEKPGHLDGGRTLSVQFFDREGHSALKVFLNFGGRPTKEREAWFAGVRGRFAKG
jgi:putative heme iron utilization protein